MRYLIGISGLFVYLSGFRQKFPNQKTLVSTGSVSKGHQGETRGIGKVTNFCKFCEMSNIADLERGLYINNASDIADYFNIPKLYGSERFPGPGNH